MLTKNQNNYPYQITEPCKNNKFFKFTEETAKMLRTANLSKNARTLWDYIVTTNPFGDEEITATQILTELNWKEHTYYRAVANLRDNGLVPEWMKIKTTKNLEQEVTKRLQKELGGLREVVTTVGRIDLLTETELIEVKNIKSWKQALGQILAYSAFYPEHKKRIHLFGEDLSNLQSIELSCLTFDVLVTGEILVNKEVK